MLLRTEHLTKDYGRHRALDDFNLTVNPGEVFGLLGPNGSGKSTALRLLLGFLRPTAGHAWIADHECWQDGVAARGHVAYLPGELRLYESMTGRQLIEFLGELRGRPRDGEVDRLAHRLEIDLNRPISQLSSGMKRKVALLQVLVPHADLLVLDEPTNTLDPTMRDELLALLRQAGDNGQAVLFSSHVLSEVERIGDRVGILQGGRLVHIQPMKELRAARLIHVRFLREPASVPNYQGLRVRASGDSQFTVEYDGPLPPLLDWLSRQEVSDLRIEPLGLAGVYHRFHGAER